MRRIKQAKTIRIQDDTHKVLHRAGKHGESFDRIIKRLIKEAKEK